MISDLRGHGVRVRSTQDTELKDWARCTKVCMGGNRHLLELEYDKTLLQRIVGCLEKWKGTVDYIMARKW